MKNRMRNIFIAGLLLSAVSPAAVLAGPAGLKCGTTTIDVRQAPYSTTPGIQGSNVNVYSAENDRIALDSAMAAKYRTINGAGTLGENAIFRAIYKNGSRECVGITSASSSSGARPIPGFQRDLSDPVIVEDSITLNYFRVNYPHPGWYRICYDYFSNGQLTQSECVARSW